MRLLLFLSFCFLFVGCETETKRQSFEAFDVPSHERLQTFLQHRKSANGNWWLLISDEEKYAFLLGFASQINTSIEADAFDRMLVEILDWENLSSVAGKIDSFYINNQRYLSCPIYVAISDLIPHEGMSMCKFLLLWDSLQTARGSRYSVQYAADSLKRTYLPDLAKQFLKSREDGKLSSVPDRKPNGRPCDKRKN